MKKMINKKNLILLSLLLLLPLFVGCNGTPPINHAPTITSTPINTATVSLLYTYNVDATDPDGDTLTYALTVSPPGMSINPSTGVISWTPTSAQIGDYNVTVEVTDGEFQDIQSFIVTSWLTVIVTLGPVHNITQNTTYSTIQAALNAANSNDIIEVNSGTYNESITFPSGKEIFLQGVYGSTSTFIDGVNGSNTVTCNGSPPGTELRGFNISHKTGASGAGISNSNGELTITGCTIFGNSAPQPGGGIRNYKGTLTIFGSTISGNSAAVSGGGILNDQGTLNITGGSNISYNSTDYGGGICNYHGTLTIIGESTISENSATASGGGIYNDNGTSTVTGGSTISENSAAASGGGIVNDNGTSTVTGSTVSENSGWFGGGIYNGGTLTISGGSTISENSAASLGGGIYDIYGTLIITGSTISENSAAMKGGGIHMYPEASPTHIIGGSSDADTANFNTFINNKLGYTVSSAQHIRSSNSGDIHGNYPNNYYTP